MVPNAQTCSMESCCSSDVEQLAAPAWFGSNTKVDVRQEGAAWAVSLIHRWAFWMSLKVFDLSPCPSNNELEANREKIILNPMIAWWVNGTGVGELPAMGNCSGAKQPQPGLDQTWKMTVVTAMLLEIHWSEMAWVDVPILQGSCFERLLYSKTF